MNNTTISKAACWAVFLLFSCAFPAFAKQSKLKMETPDFAFPQTVASNAELQLATSLKTHKPVESLRAFMDLCVAKDLISKENAPALITRADSLTTLLPSPYNAIGDLLQAQLLNEIYGQSPWTYDSRTVDPDMANENPQFWDRKIFADKIRSLTQRALAEKEVAQTIPLKDMASLISYDGQLNSFTVYDFIVYKTIELNDNFSKAEVIPFFPAESKDLSPVELAGELIELHPQACAARTVAILTKTELLPNGQAANFLWDEIIRAGASPEAGDMLVFYYQRYLSVAPVFADAPGSTPTTPSRKEFYNYLKEIAGKPGAPKAAAEIMASMGDGNVFLQYPSKTVTSREFNVETETQNIGRYFVLLLQTTDLEENRYTTSSLPSKMKRVAYKELTINEEIPFNKKDTVSFSIDSQGKYTFIVSRSKEIKDIIHEGNYFYPSFIEASDIALISCNDVEPESAVRSDGANLLHGVFVVNAADGKPVEGATVKFQEQMDWRRKDKLKSETVKTDKDGRAVNTIPNATVIATYNGSRATGAVNEYNGYKAEDQENVRFFTDRSVYRPGDRVEFLGILYRTEDNKGSLERGKKTIVYLQNANRETVDSLELTTDRAGRIHGGFTLPKEGLLGMWRLSAQGGNARFEVAEYKTPGMLLTLEKTGIEGDSIEFKGMAATYAGMPVTDASVEFNVIYYPGRFFYGVRNEEEFSTRLTTGQDGAFSLRLPLTNLNPKEYRGVFVATSSVTDKAGETARSGLVTFCLAPYSTINPSIPEIYKVEGDTATFNVAISDITGLPTEKTVEYTVINAAGETVESGEFISPQFRLATASLPSGRYTLTFKVKDEDSEISREMVTLYREDDKTPPVETALWVPETKVTASGSRAAVSYGSSYKGQYILCIISDSKGKSEYRWIESDGMNNVIETSSPANNERKFIKFATYSNGDYFEKEVTVIPEVQTRKLEIKTETFRNLLSPGDREEWKFTIEDGGKPAEGYAYALMYDKALDAIAPLHWNSSLFAPRYRQWIRIEGRGLYLTSDRFNGNGHYVPYYSPGEFEFQTYGYGLYGRNYNIAFSRSMKASAIADDMAFVEEESVVELQAPQVMNAEAPLAGIAKSYEMADEGGVTTAGNVMKEEIELREIEMPVAFFQPILNSGKEGEVSVNFTVPDFNTTWKLVLGAYTDELKGAQTVLEATASKKVMVKMLSPRFLRTGDKAVITATIYNNSDSGQSITGEFEIYNPVDGKTLKKSESGKLAIGPSGNKVISIEFDCPSDINALGLRAYARTDGSSDGEQTIIPVLPSSQPVIEADPFYLSPGQTLFETPLPSFPENASVTFKYCDNPLWEAVTALPPIVDPETESLTSLLSALYADCTGHGILEANPRLAEGLKMITEGEAGSDMNIGNLEKDKELKTVALNNTPWVNDAKSETLRLSKLGNLLDKETAENAILNIWDKISKLRNADGGWSWCPGMKSSVWMTQNVLQRIGMLKQRGYLPDLPSEKAYMERAIKLVDEDYVKSYNEAKNKDFVLASMRNYLFVRSFFPGAPTSAAMRKIKKEALDLMEKDRGETDIYRKATAAITLYRDGRVAIAREMLASLSQFASESKDKGAWFDNLDSSGQGAAKLLTTARAIMAFNEIEPENGLVDKMRQWLLLQRQAQDWGANPCTVDVIDAILSTGSSWDGASEPPEVTIGGKKVETGEIAGLTGQITIDIPVTPTVDNIEISRTSGSPAWGGVISQYIAPMNDIKADTIPDLSIRKEIWKIEETEEGKKAVKSGSFNVGDKVRVTLIVDCGRDMDYVALTDERPACLEPAVSLSGYSATDGVWCYKETRNSATNIFFDFLPRGRHIFSYECRVMEEGTFASGVATLQCEYSPLLTAHSGGETILVK